MVEIVGIQLWDNFEWEEWQSVCVKSAQSRCMVCT